MTESRAVSNLATTQRVSFSPGRVWTLASATVTQLMRMKILALPVLLCALVVTVAFAFPGQNPEQQLKSLKDWSFGAMQLASMIIAIVATALLLPRDLEDRTLYTILSKPVPRYEYLLGKLLGVLMLIAGGLVIVDVVFSAMLWLRQGMFLTQAVAALHAEKADSPENIAQLTAILAKQGLTWSIHLGLLAIFLKSAVITALSLTLSCLASSTLFTVVIAFCMTLVGHGHELLREYFIHGHTSAAVENLLATLLAILTPDLGVFDVTDNVVNGEVITLSAAGVMAGIAAMYLVGYAVVSHLLFVEKEL